MSKQTKQGARNSANDLKMIQQIHDGARALGADCATGKAVDVNRIVARVNELKAVYGDDPIEIAGRMAGGEAYDIAAAAQALAQLAVIAADEAFEDDFEPVQVGQIVNAMRWLLVLYPPAARETILFPATFGLLIDNWLFGEDHTKESTLLSDTLTVTDSVSFNAY